MQWSQRKDPGYKEKNEDSSTESGQDHLGKKAVQVKEARPMLEILAGLPGVEMGP